MTHSLHIEGEKIFIGGVGAVKESNDGEIAVRLEGGRSLVLTGKGLNIERLDLSEGKLNAVGEVNAVKYTKTLDKKNLVKRIFK